MSHLHAVPNHTREQQITALANHILHNPEACREVAEHIVDGTETLAKAGAEIERLRGLLGGDR